MLDRNKQILKSAASNAAGLIKRLLSIEDIANLVVDEVPNKRGSYKKKTDIDK